MEARAQAIWEELEKAINDAFGDQSVGAAETLEIMEEARSAISINIDALREDLKKE